MRIGLHTGECELLENDIGGIAVHFADRVAATAQSAEVLVSSTVKDLVVGSGIRGSLIVARMTSKGSPAGGNSTSFSKLRARATSALFDFVACGREAFA